jgi:hypothetical protein
MFTAAISACAVTGPTPTLPASAGPADTPTPISSVPGAASGPTPSLTTSAGSGDLAWYALPQADDLFRGAAIASLGGGPAGIVVLGNDRATGALISWTSADGDGWVRHWLPGATFGGGTPDHIVGGSFGYLALGWRLGGAAFSRALWTSSDGITWGLASATGLPGGELSTIVSGPVGAAVLVDVGHGREAVATSQDGVTWHAATPPIDAVRLPEDLVALPDGFLLLGRVGSQENDGAAWRMTDGLTWTPDPGLATQLQDRPNSIDSWQLSPLGAVGWSSGAVGMGPAVLTPAGLREIPAVDTGSWAGQVAAGPAGMLWALGSDRDATCVAAWRYVDGGWTPLAGSRYDVGCIGAAGPFVLGSAATKDGIVMIGILGSDPDRVAWLVRAPGHPPTGAAAGGPTAVPPAASIPDPLAARIDRPAACPALPTTIHDLLAITPITAAACFGDRTITFRAWVVDPGEGYGGICEAFTPAWIRECVLPDYLLAGARQAGAGLVPGLHAMRSPGATGDLAGVGRWALVQGHVDDPASPTCRGSHVAGSIGLEPERPPAQVVLECRSVFVVTSIRTVR